MNALALSTLLRSDVTARLLDVRTPSEFENGHIAGAYNVPTVTLTDSDARGPVKTQSRLSRSEVFNAVRGVFVSASNAWQPTDFPPVLSTTYEAQDSGERIYRDIELAFTTSAAMAQRLAKIELERTRQQISHEFPAKLRGLLVQPGDTVAITSTAKGWTEKPFEVVNLQFSIYEDSNGAPALGVDLSLRETAAAVYDWNSGEELTIDPAPDTDLPNPFSPVAPGIVSVVEGLYETTGSAGVKTRAWVGLGVTDDGSNWSYQVEYSLTGQNDWTVIASTRNTLIPVDELAPGIYDFRARAVNELGVASAYSAIYVKQMLGLTAPPADVTNFTVRAMNGVAWATLDRHPDLDVIQGGRIILRWSPQAAPSWNEGSLLSQDGWPGDSVLIMAPLYSGTYMAKARDSSGNMSANAVSFSITDANLTGYTTLTTLTEHATFSGTKIGLAVVSGGLELSGASTVDSVADVDAVADWDAEGGIAMVGTYSFNTTMNLGSSQTVRLFPHQRGVNSDSGQLWDDRPLTVDEWTDIDGDLVDDVESTVWLRITTDNPAGSPTWGPWHPLPGPADFTLWGAQFELRYVSHDQTHNRNVDQLSVAAKQ